MVSMHEKRGGRAPPDDLRVGGTPGPGSGPGDMDRPFLHLGRPLLTDGWHRLRGFLVCGKGGHGAWGGLGIFAAVDAPYGGRVGARQLFGMAVSPHIPACSLSIGPPALWRCADSVFRTRLDGLRRGSSALLPQARPKVPAAAGSVPRRRPCLSGLGRTPCSRLRLPARPLH